MHLAGLSPLKREHPLGFWGIGLHARFMQGLILVVGASSMSTFLALTRVSRGIGIIINILITIILIIIIIIIIVVMIASIVIFIILIITITTIFV